MVQRVEERRFELCVDASEERVIRGRIERPAGARGPLPHVIVVHGFKGFMDWGFFPVLSRRIAEAGHCAVSFNMSGSGIGPELDEFTDEAGFARNSMTRELEDLAKVAAYAASDAVPEADSSRRALVGHSFGGGLSIVHASETKDWAGLVTWAAVATLDRFPAQAKERWRETGVLEIPNARTGQVHRIELGWLEDLEANRAERFDVLAAARRLERPVWLLHGRDDESVGFDEAEALHAALPRATLVPFDRAGHTFGARHPVGAVPEVLERALEATTNALAHCFRDR